MGRIEWKALVACCFLAACGSHAPKGHTTTSGCTSSDACTAGMVCREGACVQPDPVLTPEPFVWQEAGGPGSFGNAAGILVEGSRITVSGYHQVLVSEDSGATWAASSEGLVDGMLADVVRSGDTLLTHNVFQNMIYSSLDGGKSWRAAFADPVWGFTARGDDVWVTMFKDTDVLILHTRNGLTWDSIKETPGDMGPATDLVAGDDGVLLGSMLGSFLFRSDDGGTSWRSIPTPDGSSAGGIAYWNGHILAFIDRTEGSKLAWTSDDGKNWQVQPFGFIGGWRNWVQRSPDGLFMVSAIGEVFRLRDPEGAVETLLPLDGHGGIRVQAVWGGPEGLYMVFDGDLVRWDEASHAFVPVGERPLQAHTSALAFDGTDAWAVVDGNEVHRSQDGGRTWKKVPPPVSDPTNAFLLAARNGTTWLGLGNQGLFRRRGGGDWASLNDQLPQYNGTAGEQPWSGTNLLVDDQALYLCTAGSEFAGGSDGNFVGTGIGVLRSTDRGDHWSVLDAGLPLNTSLPGRLEPCAHLDEAGGALFASMSSGIYRWAGTRWSGPLTVAGSQAWLGGLFRIGDELVGFAATRDAPGTEILVSDDGGDTWTPRESMASETVALTALSAIGQRLVLAVSRRGDDPGPAIYASDDAGLTWTPFGGGNLDGPPWAMAVTPDELLVAVDRRGVQRLPLAAMP